ncbi:hypothetical protein [Streptomyces diastatochromogenes]|uniref:hypothetical protein n=1 Tax=Streptomyces diastatochromogenes TaxID=42236 RepID=UPI00369C543B
MVAEAGTLLGYFFREGPSIFCGAARGTIGGPFPFWQRHRYTRSQRFPQLHVVLAGKAEHLLDSRLQVLAADVKGIAVAVWVNTLPRLQRGEPWYEIGVDDPDRRRRRYPEPPGH